MARTFLFVFIIVFASSPLVSLPAFGASADIVINEIGASESSDHEWIEIYNKGTTPVDLTGWKFFEDGTNHGLTAFRGDMIIQPGEYAIIADVATNTATDYPAFTGTLIDSAWTTLNESGESIALKDNLGVIIEQFTYISAPTHSLERIDATHAEYTAINWQEHANGNTIGAINSVSIPPPDDEEPPSDDDTPPADDDEEDPPPQDDPPADTPPAEDPPEDDDTPPTPSPVTYHRGDMLINEFVSDPDDEDVEWIELYNPLIRDVNLTNWTIEDGSQAKTILSGTIGSNANNRFFVIETPKGKLNNPGDLILLKDPTGTVIDEVAYGNWDDGNKENNAPAPKDPFSCARLKDGNNTYNNNFDFKLTTTPTKGSSNVIIDPDAPTDGGSLPFIKTISITELFPDPIGPDTKDEFIELYNSGDTAIDLLHWEIVNNAGRKYVVNNKKLTNTVIQPHSYFVLFRPVTGMALKNTGGDGIKLYQPNSEKPNTTLAYTGKTTQGNSYALFSDGQTGWTTTPTPGGTNIQTTANQAPDPDIQMLTTGEVLEEISFDASDSVDPEQDPLTFVWDFGDGQKGDGMALSHHYLKAGRYKVSLTVSDGIHKKTITKTILIKDQTQSTLPDPTTPLPDDVGGDLSQSIPGISPIVINEIVPNPKGKDINEYIELTNISNAPIDISGWRVTYQLGKKSFTFPTSSMIEPGGLLTLTPQAHKIQLRNVADTITLYNAQGEFMDLVSYEDAPEGQSLSRTREGDFVWVHTASVNKPNITDTPPESLAGPQSTLTTAATAAKTTKTTNTKVAVVPIQTTLADVRDVPLNTSVSVQGIVSSLPGTLGANVFYVAGSGIQVYVSKSQMPRIVVGDVIKLTGLLSQISGETRIKVAQASDIHLISHGTPPAPHTIRAGDVSEEYEGSLVTLTGEVVKVQWPSIYIDDGTDEARVYIKESTGIARLKIEKESTLQITGVVSQTTSGYRILPRTTDDLVITSSAEQTQTSTTTPILDTTTLALTASEKPIPIAQIGVVSLFGIIFLASSMYIQKKTPTQ